MSRPKVQHAGAISWRELASDEWLVWDAFGAEEDASLVVAFDAEEAAREFSDVRWEADGHQEERDLHVRDHTGELLLVNVKAQRLIVFWCSVVARECAT